MVLTAAYPPRLNGLGGSQGTFSPVLSSPFSPSTDQRTQIPLLERTTSTFNMSGQTENIMNRKGGTHSSLYQSCIALKKRVANVPGFPPYLEEMDREEAESTEATDPVTYVWNLLRQGLPLMAIYNALQPKKLLEIELAKTAEAKIGKKATFTFLQACMFELRFPPDECFLITDLYGSDTSGLVKVLKVVNRVIDILSERGMLMWEEEAPSKAGAEDSLPRSHQQKIIDEIVTSERDYVQHLETLHQFKIQLEQSGAIKGDIVHDIFLNLNSLLDFQRRFLIRIEQQNSLETTVQNWGTLFAQYHESFMIYEPFIANQNRCNDVVNREWEKIRAAPLPREFQGMVETQSILGSFLMKPFQRLTKYPMLLKELSKTNDLDQERMEDLQAGSEAISSILTRANQAVDEESLRAAVEDLQGRVEDWKNHSIERFGKLLVYGTHTVLKGDAREVEREYNIYLFQNILLCCKEVNPNKAKNRLGNKGVDKRGKPRLQLKGRIFMQNVTDILQFSKNGTYFLQIFWKGDPSVEHFVIRFPMEEMRNKWKDHVEKQKISLNNIARNSGQNGTSATEFTYMRSQTNLENPHAHEQEQDDDVEDDDTRVASDNSAISAIGTQPVYTMSRNASSTSLRSKSTASGSSSLATQLPSRVAPPRFHIPDHVHVANGPPPLTIATNISSPATPDERALQSYFSPTAESPVSMRSNSQASMYPFPRQPIPSSNGWGHDDNKHNTAPAIGRSHRDQPSLNGYPIDGQTGQRISSQSLHQSVSQSRSRSASSPDIQNNNQPGQRRHPNGLPQGSYGPAEPVPPIPAHMASMRATVTRSQTNSPVETRRNISQSPKTCRDRGLPQVSSHYSYDQSQQPYRSDSRYLSGQSTSGVHMSAIGERIMSPPITSSQGLPDAGTIKLPNSIKVKIYYGNEVSTGSVIIIVASKIEFRQLVDRIDQKMQKMSSGSIVKGTARLRYKDQDGDKISMTSSWNLVDALKEYKDINGHLFPSGEYPDLELYWVEGKFSSLPTEDEDEETDE